MKTIIVVLNIFLILVCLIFAARYYFMPLDKLVISFDNGDKGIIVVAFLALAWTSVQKIIDIENGE